MFVVVLLARKALAIRVLDPPVVIAPPTIQIAVAKHAGHMTAPYR
ncbi:MAG TPA: hypothetical protein VE779_07220 [Candidatus Angelobacter sp.]|nr:hypothetical protein [Candidatus Angelobacter sp.]